MAWQRFTERARQLILFAQEEAVNLGENYVSTEHMLLAMIRPNGSMASQILEKMGVSLAQIKTEVHLQVRRGDNKPGQDLQLMPRAKRVIDLAYNEAHALQVNYMGTEHILLGLIAEGEGLAARVLKKLGVDLEITRSQIKMSDGTGGRNFSPLKRTAVSSQTADSGSVEIPLLRLNDEARQSMIVAEKEAARLGESLVSTEHLLLGLLDRRENAATRILVKMNFTIEEIRIELLKDLSMVEPSNDYDLPFAPPVIRALNFAYAEMKQDKKQEIGTEYLLLGLIRESESIAARVLTKLGIEKGIREVMGAETKPEEKAD